MTAESAPSNDRALRRALISQRAQLTPAEVAAASLEISAHLWRLPALARARRIGCYFPVNGEVDCRSAVIAAWDRGREVFLPVLRGRALLFAPFRPDSDLAPNQFDIPEPVCHPKRLLCPRRLHVALAPLVAFDERGNRLGMGGGYYDRSFRFLTHRPRWARPHLIGLAYEFQRVDALNAQSWDVPLRMAITEKRIFCF